MALVLYCNDPNDKGCTWAGDSSELVCLTDDLNDNDFEYCPWCEGNDFNEEEDED